MNLLSIENLSKHFNEKILFEHISFGIDDRDKIGLIGVNGTGKTTLLKILAGEESADTGNIAIGNDVKIGYLPQNPEFDEKATVLQQIFWGNSSEMRLLREYEQTVEQIDHHPSDSRLQKRLLTLSQQMDNGNIWRLESEAKSILTKLGIEDFSAVIGDLSGGQKKRIALASALINPSDLLILDEPTNHLDNEIIDWLEEYLANRKGALLMVTHDRYFLDRVVNLIIELDQAQLYSYSGNYSTFLELKAERLALEQANELRRQNILRQELAWIRRGAKARSTKQKARIQRFERLQEDEPDYRPEMAEISVVSSRLGKKVIELEHISKSFGGQRLINDFDYIILRNERAGIVGPNGSGKTTLLNIIAGILPPDSGDVAVGQTVKIGYFSQENTEMNEEQRVIEYIQEVAEFYPTEEGNSISASQMLERFLFLPEMQWSHIANLSGGERRRLYLCRVLMEAPNVLLFDEPTNDLDIQTLGILEDYLDEFPGAIIVVSHDRYFLDRVAEKIYAFEGNGQIKQYPGNYSDYQRLSREKLNSKVNEQEKSRSKVIQQNTSDTEEQQKQKKTLKFTFKEQREYAEIDDRIGEVEEELEGISGKIVDAGSDYELLQQLADQQKLLEGRLEELMERWVYLNELAEAIEKNKKR